jgi:hypothetical protein
VINITALSDVGKLTRMNIALDVKVSVQRNFDTRVAIHFSENIK